MGVLRASAPVPRAQRARVSVPIKLHTNNNPRVAAIDLIFHDLRRESGSRFPEHGMAPHYVQAFLDHANLTTTSRYLNITSQGMHSALKRVEDERIRCTAVAHAPLHPDR